MSSDSCRLADIADIQGGYAFKSADFGSSGVAVVKIANIQPPNVVLDAADRVEQHKLEGLTRFELADGDILMAMTGATVGKVARLRKTERAFLNQRVARISAKDDPELNDFIYALVSQPGFDKQIESAAAGSAQANISAAGIGAVVIPSLDRDTQLVIGSIARSIDDRITLLRETNATLEAIAQALFKSWFVDFDPVRAKAEGRPPEGMDATTASLFPDSFEESELGLVPKGWGIGCVGDLASQKKGSVNPLASPGVLYEHYSLPAFDSGQAPVFELGKEIKSNKTPLPEEAVLLSKLNPHIPRVWLPVSHGVNAVCSTEFLAYSPQGGASKELIYCLFSSDTFQQQLCQLVTGTSNSHQRVKPDQVLAVKLPIADKPALRAFTEIVRPLFDRVHAGRLQAQTLTQLRDTLLPRLISGQLRVPDAERTVEDALA